MDAQNHLETLFLLDEQGRILSTREPNPAPGPSLALILRADSAAFALSVNVAEALARELRKVVVEEVPPPNLDQLPKHFDLYCELLGGAFEQYCAFEFAAVAATSERVVQVTDYSMLQNSFSGWTEDEIPEREPIMGIVSEGVLVSVCFCARSSNRAAEAGVETVSQFRGQGLAELVTGAWASAIRASGRVPVYSTSVKNSSSRSVARKLGLVRCASYWFLNA